MPSISPAGQPCMVERAVSYTHLDVYKRQSLKASAMLFVLLKEPPEAAAFFFATSSTSGMTS